MVGLKLLKLKIKLMQPKEGKAKQKNRNMSNQKLVSRLRKVLNLHPARFSATQKIKRVNLHS